MNEVPERYQANFTAAAEHVGLRVDRFLSEMIPEYSRGTIQHWLKSGEALLDGSQVATKHKLKFGQTVQVDAALSAPIDNDIEAQPIDLNVLYEDDDLVVINKPAGLVMHPGAGTPNGTIQNALLHHFPVLEHVPRAGIVHRLDKDTSGLFVVAKTLLAHASLVDQLQERTVSRRYDAVILGLPIAGATIDEPIGRHPTDRTKMAIVRDGREAISHYRVIESFRGHTWVQVQLETGRTHQIRVHMSHRRMPLIGDKTYGGRLRTIKGMGAELVESIRQFPRQALNASKLSLIHPRSGEEISWEAPIADDMIKLLTGLRNDKKQADKE